MKGRLSPGEFEEEHHASQAYYDKLWEQLSVGFHRQRDKRDKRDKMSRKERSL